VGEHDVGHALDGGRLVGHEGRIAGEERIDQHGLAGEVEPEGGMAVPRDLHDGDPRLDGARVVAEHTLRHRKINATRLGRAPGAC
jgi:hypothetical protein